METKKTYPNKEKAVKAFNRLAKQHASASLVFGETEQKLPLCYNGKIQIYICESGKGNGEYILYVD